MSVNVPEPNMLDRLLRRLGKSRAVIIPKDTCHYHGKETQILCKKESLWVSLIRPRKQQLPEDRADIFRLQKIYCKTRSKKGISI